MNSSHIKQLFLYNLQPIFIHLTCSLFHCIYSTVTAFARFRGLSTSVPLSKAT